MFEFIRNLTAIPTEECTPSCARPCRTHYPNFFAKILGSDVSVKKVGSIWANNAVELSIVSAYLINQKAFMGGFTPEEFDNYKSGVMDMIQFMEQCLDEAQIKKEDSTF